jgi:hypothetical protein
MSDDPAENYIALCNAIQQQALDYPANMPNAPTSPPAGPADLVLNPLTVTPPPDPPLPLVNQPSVTSAAGDR